MLDWRGTLALAGPFVVLIGGHFLARYRYYGEWLPNTYYAKHVGPWYESGFRYLSAAAIETGLYLLIPLAYVALRARWREHRDGLYALVLLVVGTHMAYLFEIGGDLYEYRPMDFYWPLLAVPAAGGVARVADRLADLLRRLTKHLRWPGPRFLAIALFVPLVFYASAIQAVLLFEGTAVTRPDFGVPPQVVLDESNSGWVQAAPGMPALVAISNDLRLSSEPNFVGLRTHQHHGFNAPAIPGWQAYEESSRQVIPSDAVMYESSIGIVSYYLPNLTVIDLFGLADHTIARNPVTLTNSERRIAHDRSAPPGYLQRRGVNIRLYPAVATEAEALARANYAVKVGPETWMPFDVFDHIWANERFAGRDLRAINRYSQTDPAGNRFAKDGGRYVGEQFLGRFDGTDLDGWHREGKAVTNHALAPFPTGSFRFVAMWGLGFLTTYFPGKWERTGRAYSPTFKARDDQYLMFLIAGELHERRRHATTGRW